MQLLRQNQSQHIRIHLIEKTGVIGRGVAYDTSSDMHLLNVPASRMSIWPEDPGHFYRWLQVHHHDIGPMGFAPRSVFGSYIQHNFQELIHEDEHQKMLITYQAEALALSKHGSTFAVQLSNGDNIVADKVILAIGNFPPAAPKGIDVALLNESLYFNNPWNPAIVEQVISDNDVLIIGSGLTMVDIVCLLKQRGHRGKIHSVSTHGFVPQVHEFGDAYPDFYDSLKDKTEVLSILKAFRKELKKAHEMGMNWRAVIDSIRPHTQEIWSKLPPAELKKFVEHIRHIWGVARHRMPPENARILEAMLEQNQLQLSAGRMVKVTKTGSKFEMEYVHSNLNQVSKATGEVLINCTGPQSDYSKINNPLLKDVLHQGLARKDSLSMGFDTTKEGQLINADGKMEQGLYTIGPPMKGILWEITAVPEIKMQAEKMAASIMHQLTAE